MSKENADVVIVGAGASGSVLAKELASAGLRTVLLERGPELDPQKEIYHDELNSYGDGGLRSRVGSEQKFAPREFRNQGDEQFSVIYPHEWGYASGGAAVGGGQAFFGALMWRRPPIDFSMKSEYGHVAGTTLEDWPVTYDQLEPYFEKAEYEMGVSGEGGVNPFEGKRGKPFPFPPIDLQPGDVVIRETVKKMGLHPFVVPLGIITENSRGRLSCIGHPCCNGYLC